MGGCDFPECGVPGRMYVAMCVHEHNPPGKPLELCAVHAAQRWWCARCARCKDYDGHECPIALTEVASA